MASKLILALFIGWFAALSASAQNEKADAEVLKNAIVKTKAYLSAESTEIDLQSLFLYQYVQRKFDLNQISDKQLENQIEENHLFYPFLRLVEGVNPNVDSTVFVKVGSAIDRVTLKSMYCDKFPLEESFLDTLIAASENGKYALTHALWSLTLMDENGCLGNLKGNEKVTENIAIKVAQMVNDAGFKDDIAIEGICFLYGMSRKDLINPSWIRIIMGHQASDGGFYRTAKNSTTNTKTTILALWCMLEYQTNGSVKEPWIH